MRAVRFEPRSCSLERSFRVFGAKMVLSRKMGRPKKNIDERQILKLAELGCSCAEIASVVDCSVRTIETRFREIVVKGKENLKVNLRRAQVRLALSGDRTMLIWLGKQYLGQREQSYLDIDVDVKKLSDEELEARTYMSFCSALVKVAVGSAVLLTAGSSWQPGALRCHR